MALLVLLAFKRYSDDKLVIFAHTVYQRMSTDTQYVAFKTSVDEVETINSRLIACIADAKLGGTDRTSKRDDAKKDLVRILVKLAGDLQHTALDNERFVTDSGFEVRNTSRKNQKNKTAPAVLKELDVPTLVVTNLENFGSVESSWNEVPNALMYALQYRIKGETVWQNGQYNHIGEFTFMNLESEKVYEFQVRALGPFSTSSAWSPAVVIYVS
jgi:hypothetical protein